MKTKFRLLEHVDVDSITRDMTDEEIKKKQEFMEALRQSCDFATYKVYSECLEGVPLYLYYPDDREIKEGDYDLGLTSLDSFGNKKIIINGDLLDDFDDYVIEPTEEDPEGASIYDPKDKKLHVTGMMIAVMIFKHEMLHIFLEHLIRTEAKFQKWYVENYPNDPKGGSYHFLSAEKWRLIGNYAGDWDLSRYYLPAELELTRKGHLRIYGDKLKLLALEFDRPEWFNSKPPLTLEQLLEKILESKDEVITEVEKGKLPPVWKNANLNPPRSAEEKRNEVVELENRYVFSDDDIRIMSERWNKRSLLADSLDARQRILSSVEKRSQAGEKKSPARSKYMAAAGIILLFIAVVLALILPVPAFAAAASGGVLILFAIILGAGDSRVKSDQDQAENEMVEDLKRELKSDVEYIRAADEYFAGIMGDYDMTWSSEHVNQFILELMSGRLACRRAGAEYDKALETLLSFEKRNTSIIGDMDPDTDARDNNLSNDGVLAGEGPVSMEKISRAMVVLAEKIENAGQRSMACKNRLDIVRESLDKWRKDKAALEELYMVQAAEEKKYKLLSAAREKLAAAKQTMLSRYSDPVLESFMRYHAMVTGESSEGYHVDADLNVTYEEEGMPRPQSTLSSGRRDLTGLCLRLALADAMYGEDKPFLILDDSFSNFDDHNMKGIAGLLEKVSESYQIVYMTCSSSRIMKDNHITSMQISPTSIGGGSSSEFQ